MFRAVKRNVDCVAFGRPFSFSSLCATSKAALKLTLPATGLFVTFSSLKKYSTAKKKQLYIFNHNIHLGKYTAQSSI